MKSVKGKGADTLKKLLLELKQKKNVKVGWFKEHKYPAKDGGLPVAYVAAIQEYGWPEKRIPARPFMSRTAKEKITEWKELARKIASRVAKGKATLHDGLELLGAKAAAQVQNTIEAVDNPPLSKYTIAQRLKRYKKKEITESLTKPLIDTGYMQASITYTQKDV